MMRADREALVSVSSGFAIGALVALLVRLMAGCILPAPVLAPDASDGGWILAHTSPTFDAGNGSLR